MRRQKSCTYCGHPSMDDPCSVCKIQIKRGCELVACPEREPVKEKTETPSPD